MAKRRGNQEGSIYQDAAGRWRGAVTIGYKPNNNGGVTQVRKVLSGITRGDVADQMKKALREQQQGTNIMPERMTVSGLMKRWLEDVVKPCRSYKTYCTYRDLNEHHISPVLGPTLLSKLSTPMVQRFLNQKHQDGLSPKTVKHVRDCLRAALNVAVNDWDLLSKNAAKKAKPPAQIDSPMRVLNPDQARALLQLVSEHRLEALFSLALCLGPRQGEVLGARWENLDIGAGKLLINGALKRVEGKLVKGKTKTDTSNRPIHLPAVTIAALRRHQLRHEQERQWAGNRWKESGFIFTTGIGTPIERRNLLRDWYKLLKDSGLPKIRFHDLRHSAATLLFAQGVHPKTVMEILGHSDLHMTMKVYGHVLDQMKREAATKMDELFGFQDRVATSSATRAGSEATVN